MPGVLSSLLQQFSPSPEIQRATDAWINFIGGDSAKRVQQALRNRENGDDGSGQNAFINARADVLRVASHIETEIDTFLTLVDDAEIRLSRSQRVFMQASTAALKSILGELKRVTEVEAVGLSTTHSLRQALDSMSDGWAAFTSDWPLNSKALTVYLLALRGFVKSLREIFNNSQNLRNAAPQLQPLGNALDSLSNDDGNASLRGLQEVERLRALKNQKRASSKTADDAISMHYQSIAASENRAAAIFRWSAIVVFLASIGFAVKIVIDAITANEQVGTTLLLKVSFAVPAIFFAGYLNREGSQHRTVARRSKEFRVRLQTVDAFLEDFDEQTRWRIREAVGMSILTGPPMLGVEDNGLAIDPQKVLDNVLENLRPNPS